METVAKLKSTPSLTFNITLTQAKNQQGTFVCRTSNYTAVFQFDDIVPGVAYFQEYLFGMLA